MSSKNNLIYSYGIIMLIGFLVYFFLMKLLGLYTEPAFRIFNVAIHGTIIYLAMKRHRGKSGEVLRWGKTVLVGLRVSVIGVIGFSIFQFLYLSLNPEFLFFIKENAIMGDLLTPVRASFFLLAEGFGITVFFSYLGMRFLEIQELQQRSGGKITLEVQEQWREKG